VICEGRFHRLQVDRVLQRTAGLQEQVAVDGGQGEQRRPGIEDEAVLRVAGKLAPEGRCLLQDLDLVALDGQSRGHGQAARHRCR
jgi:hypothetical protein